MGYHDVVACGNCCYVIFGSFFLLSVIMRNSVKDDRDVVENKLE